MWWAPLAFVSNFWPSFVNKWSFLAHGPHLGPGSDGWSWTAHVGLCQLPNSNHVQLLFIRRRTRLWCEKSLQHKNKNKAYYNGMKFQSSVKKIQREHQLTQLESQRWIWKENWLRYHHCLRVLFCIRKLTSSLPPIEEIRCSSLANPTNPTTSLSSSNPPSSTSSKTLLPKNEYCDASKHGWSGWHYKSS